VATPGTVSTSTPTIELAGASVAATSQASVAPPAEPSMVPNEPLAFSEILPPSATADEPSTDEPAPVTIAVARPSAAPPLTRISTIPSTGEPQSDDSNRVLFLLAIAASGVLLRRLVWQRVLTAPDSDLGVG